MRDWKNIVVDKVEREQLKHDRFVEEVTHSVEYAVGQKAGHAVRQHCCRLLVVGFGVWFYLGKQAEARQADLREAILIQDAAVGPGSNPYLKTFPTQAEKEAAALKSFSALAAKHGSSEVGAIAKYYQGVIYADQEGHRSRNELQSGGRFRREGLRLTGQVLPGHDVRPAKQTG
jgi:hypothetical protein